MMQLVGSGTLTKGFMKFHATAVTSVYTEKAFENACQWEGVSCDENSIIRCLEWENKEWDRPESAKFRLSYMFLRFLPPTLVKVAIKHQPWLESGFQKDDVNTRCFPRRAVDVALVACKLTGTIDMTCLPVNLMVLILRQNRLYGTILLKHLPPTLETVDLQGNPIDRVIVSNDSLPMGLKQINFLSHGKIVIEESDHRPVDDRVVVCRQKGEKVRRG
uniref:Uncharacterized protein n=1 Tax=Paramoeba aestuarina TaxID=180227 RepID=A0A7S4KHV5_9EUKA|mmetsp:Transcript_1957/g.3017  ORF Transcript_1957/g.3017 Transcript_1957/m.3017 type:complete len:218 (+) Transcript_1957:3-656(+)